MEINSLVIIRSKWARQTEGVDKGGSMLMNSQGCLCCLGFVGRAVGIASNFLEDIGSPKDCACEDVVGSESEVAKWPQAFAPLEEEDSLVSSKAIEINDNGVTTDAYKEAALTTLFASVGIKLTFENGLGDPLQLP